MQGQYIAVTSAKGEIKRWNILFTIEKPDLNDAVIAIHLTVKNIFFAAFCKRWYCILYCPIFFVFRVHTLRVSNSLTDVGDAWYDNSGDVLGAVPVPAGPRALGEDGQHPSTSEAASGVCGEGRGTDLWQTGMCRIATWLHCRLLLDVGAQMRCFQVVESIFAFAVPYCCRQCVHRLRPSFS